MHSSKSAPHQQKNLALELLFFGQQGFKAVI